MVKNKITKPRFSKQQLKKSIPLLQLLSKSSPEERKCVLSFLNDNGVELICQCVKNSLGNNDIDPKHQKTIIQDLREFSPKLRYVSNPKRKVHLRRKQLIQLGGNPLAFILSAALPLLTSILFPKK